MAMKKTMSEEILAVAAREIGYREGVGHQNKFGAWYGMNNVQWCMQFVQWCYAQAGAPLPFKTASCGELLRWYQRNQPECVAKEPVPGCIVIFNFPGTLYSTDHTGLFVKIDCGYITTIDGNTSGVNDANGGYVQRRTRPLSYANPVYIVPRELKTDDGKEDEKGKRYNTMEEISAEAPWAAETVAKLIARGVIKGSGVTDEQGRPADMNLSHDMLRLLVFDDRAELYG